MSFNDEVWQAIAGLYRAILDHPFNVELAAGTLARERFVLYMIQDAHYLNAFGRALAVCAARAPENADMVQLAGSARAAIVVEQALHEGFFERFGVGSEQARTTPPSPTGSHYAGFLLSHAFASPWEVAVAALLPCFQIYWEVGKHELQIAAADNPYQAWIDTYADEAFADGVRAMIALADRLADTTTPALRGEMRAAYVKSSQLEWMFWDAAYRLESWPVTEAGRV
jgi:thiaminase (transcriptional activator TenA)